ncbi:hypothetical protein F4801DRAFT_121775 [Xylaria longipes]|nr:hypothetical protein F4801DRAFT_121775 [Xylaria longipes]
MLSSLKLAICKEKRDSIEIEQLVMRIQWDQLIYNPILSLRGIDTPIVFVIDALDECEGLDRGKVMGMINLFISTAAVQNVTVRFLITSRPESHIQTAFEEFSGKVHHIILDEIDRSTVDKDISQLFEDGFKSLRHETRGVEPHWPSQEQTRGLIKRANGLFIYAAMICRYIRGLAGNKASSVKDRLARVFQDQAFETLDDMYSYILTQAVTGQEQDALTKQIKMILGVIIGLLEPMPVTSLRELCPDNPELDVIYSRLDSLCSVLVVPEPSKGPVYISHHSFREFLLRKRDGNGLIWINEQVHQDLFTACIQLLSRQSKGGLRRDICGLNHPGSEVNQVDGRRVEDSIPIHTRYACRHWIDHLRELGPSQRQEIGLRDHGVAHTFLQMHLLHWLEALSLLRIVPEGVRMIQMLSGMLDANGNPQFYAFSKDAERLILYNREIIEKAPLQVYCSALIFAPQQSLIRRQFEQEMPSWISRLPEVQPNWTSLRMTIGPVSNFIDRYERGNVAFSEDGELIVHISGTGELRVWNATTGALLNEFKKPRASCFSPKAKLAALLHGNSVEIVDAASGTAVHELRVPSHQMPSQEYEMLYSVAFSPDDKQVATAISLGLVYLWEVGTGRLMGTLDAFTKKGISMVTGLAYSPDNKFVAAGLKWTDQPTHLTPYVTPYVWRVDEGSVLYKHETGCGSYAFSPDLRLIAIILFERAQVLDIMTGDILYTIDDCEMTAFSPDGKLATFQIGTHNPQLRDAETGAPVGATLLPSSCSLWLARNILFSSDGKLLVMVLPTYLLLWDVTTGETQKISGDNYNSFFP